MKVPDYGSPSLGIAGTPAAPRNDSQVAASGLASLQGKIGEGLETLDTRMRAVEHARNVTAATKIGLDATRAMDELQFKADNDPDFRTSLPGFQQSVSELRKRTVDGIEDPQLSALVSSHFDKLAITKEFEVKRKAWGREKDDAVATLDQALDVTSQSYAKAGTQAGRDTALEAGLGTIDESAKAGWISREDAEKRKSGLRNSATSLWVRTVGIDDPHEAVKMLEDPGKVGLDEKMRVPLLEHFSAKAEQLDRQNQAIAAADAKASFDTEQAAIGDRGFGVIGDAAMRGKFAAAGYTPAMVDDMMGHLQRQRTFYNDTTRLALMPPADRAALISSYDARTKGAGFDPIDAKNRDNLAQANDALNRALATDPKGYAVRYSPAVRSAFDAASKDPTKLEAAVTALDGVYDKLGVPSYMRSVFSKGEASDLVNRILSSGAGDQASAIDGMAQQYGKLWPRIMGDMVAAGLPSTFNAAAAMKPGPVRIAAFEALSDGKKDVKSSLAKDDLKSIGDAVDASVMSGDLSRLRLSMAYAENGEATFGQIRQTVQLAAERLAPRMGTDQAVRAAVASVTSDLYDFSRDGARVPKGQLQPILDTANRALAAVKPEDLRPEVYGAPPAPGLKEPGNIDLATRPVVRNPDGTISTVRSLSIGTDKGEVLIPTVGDEGAVLSNEDAIGRFATTGQHLGIFDTPENATRYAKRLHDAQAKTYGADLENLLSSARRGRWVTNGSDNGLVRLDERGVPVILKNGNRLEVPFAGAKEDERGSVAPTLESTTLGN